MQIGGFRKISLIDYPKKISSVVFTVGCNFKCPYCHNSELVRGDLERMFSMEEILGFLRKRKGKIDAVVITGGEPTLQKDLIDFIMLIKNEGFLIKLDTNGSKPEIISKLLSMGVVDYIAMDVKAPLEKYGVVVGSAVDTERIKESIRLISQSGIDYEFRTTLVKGLLTEGDVLKIGELIKGSKKYVLQKFIPSKPLDSRYLTRESFSYSDFERLKSLLEERFVKSCVIRYY